ncbi:putative powdery mildew resistance protein, RPW8 [Helianthus anomalus]
MDVKSVHDMALETELVELMEAVASEINRTPKFRTLLKRLDKTLTNIQPILHESARLSKVLDRPEPETKMFVIYLGNGKKLVLECSVIKWWNVHEKFDHANKLIRLDHELLRFFGVELQDYMTLSLRTLKEVYDLSDKMDRVLSTVSNQAGGFSSSFGVPELRDFIVGLDAHLQELKRILLNDANQVLTVSAPGGCGKTTLAKMLCHDNEIKGMSFLSYSRFCLLNTATILTSVESEFEF